MRSPNKSRRGYYWFVVPPSGGGFNGAQIDYGSPYAMEFSAGQWWYKMQIGPSYWATEDELYASEEEAVRALQKLAEASGG